MSATVYRLPVELHIPDVQSAPDLLRLRTGQPVAVRFVAPQDGVALQAYFATLSPRARYNRFTGASNGLSNQELALLLRIGEQNRFAVITETTIHGVRTIVGEARYTFDAATWRVEFGLSVHDGYQGQGIGFALLSNIECRAAAFGARWMFGDTLQTNTEMQALARKAGFAFTHTPGDWRQVRLLKAVDGSAEHYPCAGWRMMVADAERRLST